MEDNRGTQSPRKPQGGWPLGSPDTVSNHLLNGKRTAVTPHGEAWWCHLNPTTTVDKALSTHLFLGQLYRQRTTWTLL